VWGLGVQWFWTVGGTYVEGCEVGVRPNVQGPTDPTPGTAHWTANTITHTTAADLYVSNDGVYPTQESFTITNNTLKKTTGV
jgi:hypothetical protein